MCACVRARVCVCVCEPSGGKMLWHRDVQMLSWCLQNWGPGGRWEERVLAPDRLLGKSPPFPP